jgi:hypothetical protein
MSKTTNGTAVAKLARANFLVDMDSNGTMAPTSQLEWKARMRNLILEHRPWTLDGEMETLLNIAQDVYISGLEDASILFKLATKTIAAQDVADEVDKLTPNRSS